VDDVPAWTTETDVAVVGFGAAGACASIEAAEAGAQVILLEAGSGSGGASALSGGEIYIGGGTEIQRAAGFDDSVEAMATYLKLAGGPDADQAKCDLYAENSLAHFEWLKQQGVPYKGTYLPGRIIEPPEDDTLIWSGSEEAWPYSEAAKPAPRGHVIQFMGWGGGRKLMDVLESRCSGRRPSSNLGDGRRTGRRVDGPYRQPASLCSRAPRRRAGDRWFLHEFRDARALCTGHAQDL
jgi:choline dehydrogenase-like flavoprotein